MQWHLLNKLIIHTDIHAYSQKHQESIALESLIYREKCALKDMAVSGTHMDNNYTHTIMQAIMSVTWDDFNLTYIYFL